LKAKTIITCLVILTLLIGFSSGNFLNPVFAEDETPDETTDETTDEDVNDEGETIEVELKEELGMSQK